MIQLLYPIGLLAAAAIIIPVIIHLWNVTHSKTMKIGSVALLGESSRQSSKSYTITDWPLFILRCLLLIILAGMLTQPFLKTELGAARNNGWILIEKSGINQAHREYRKEIDSLLNLDYELREMSPGFESLSLKDSSQAQLNPVNLSYSSLLKQLNGTLPPGFKVYVFVENSLKRHEGDLPQLSIDLNWRSINNTDSVRTWVSKAFFTAKDSIRTVLVHSSPSGSYTEVFNLSDQLAQAKRIELKLDSGKTQLRSTTQSEWITADTASILVSVYQNMKKNDAAYVESAIMSIRQYSQRKIRLVTTGNISAIPTSSDFVFWLSPNPVDKVFRGRLKKGAAIFSYESGKEELVNSFINLGQATNSQITRPALFKRIGTDDAQGDIIWSDGFGLPVLTAEDQGNLVNYHFYSRLDPQYSSLVWNDDFVKALMPLLISSGGEHTAFGFEDNPADMRRADNSTWMHNASFVEGGSAKIYTDKPISNWLWLVAILVFTAERILSFRKNRV